MGVENRGLSKWGWGVEGYRHRGGELRVTQGGGESRVIEMGGELMVMNMGVEN